MAEYLVENPPYRPQFRKRRDQLSGVIVLHSAENLPDVKPPDTGAEDVSRFIRDRRDVGSYHTLGDSDSAVRLVPFDLAAYHDGTGTNDHSIGISGAFRAAQFDGLPEAWRRGCRRTLAIECRVAADHVRRVRGIVVPPRRITVAQARAKVPGFVTHGMLDPGRRSDPDGTRTGDGWEWDEFFHDYELGAPASTEEADMGDMLERIRHGYRDVRGRDYDPEISDREGWRHWVDKLTACDTRAQARAVLTQCLGLLWIEAVNKAKKEAAK